MDAALSKRAKVRAAGLSDSEKILLQLRLDVQAYAAELRDLGIDPTHLPSYAPLTQEVGDSALSTEA